MENQSNEFYDNLLHSLTHPHLKDNHDRHVLVLEKWCVTYAEGLYIKDIKFIKEIFSIVKDKLVTQADLYMPLLPKILSICSKVLVLFYKLKIALIYFALASVRVEVK